jgi:hypothetical protein
VSHLHHSSSNSSLTPHNRTLLLLPLFSSCGRSQQHLQQQ